MVIPYLLQGDESRIMKQAGFILMKKSGDTNSKPYTKLVIYPTFTMSGSSVEGSAKEGKTWAETH
jgi:hypothetical protein